MSEAVACSLEVGQDISAAIWNWYKHFCLLIRSLDDQPYNTDALEHKVPLVLFVVYSQTNVQ